MPRRKKARQTQGSRSRPKLPEGALETSMTEDERKAKLDFYLKDFDVQVQARATQIETLGNALIKKIQSGFKMEILKFPLHIRKMKFGDFMAQGGQLNDNAVAETSKLVTEMTMSIFQNGNGERPVLVDVGNTQIPVPGPQSVKYPIEKELVNIKCDNCVPVQGQNQTTEAPRSLRPRKRKGVPMSPSTAGRQTRSKAVKTENQMPPPSTIRRSRRTKQTPAVGGKVHYATPMVTPKFDPRLPITPALLREAREGERIISMTGSPIVNRGSQPVVGEVYIPLGQGKTFHVSAESDLSTSQTPCFDATAKRNINLLREQLTRLLQIPAHLEK